MTDYAARRAAAKGKRYFSSKWFERRLRRFAWIFCRVARDRRFLGPCERADGLLAEAAGAPCKE